MTEKVAIKTWSDLKDLTSTADIEIPADPLDRVLGQEEAIALAKIAARQRRHLLLVGPPGTGTSMIARAISKQRPTPKTEVRVANTPQNPERPFLQVVEEERVV
ncbi:MAG: ATP-binding protein, partial [Candidatus Methanomethylophilaceae archaeon]|nr:ATP-binding protein [Candidatus Methanomethylophilaceae archaeon]